MINYHGIWNNFIKGRKSAFLKLYEEFYPQLYRYGIKYTADQDLIKDQINEVFTYLYEKRARIGQVVHVKAYIFQCFKNSFFHQLKKSPHFETLAEPDREVTGPAERPYEDYIIQLQAEERIKGSLRSALAKLTKRQRVLIQLRYYEELSIDQIALKTGLSSRTIYNKLHEGLKILRKEMAPQRENFIDSLSVLFMMFRKK